VTTPFSPLKPLEPLMDACVHCGFCLPTCPSYVLLGRETDSPRGRIYLMRAGLDERITLTNDVVGHFDTCLGCMACETACPSGVRYAPLIERTRSRIEGHHRRPISERWFRRILFSLLPYPSRLRAIGPSLVVARLIRGAPALVRLLPSRLRSLLSLAPDVRAGALFQETAAITKAETEKRRTVGLLTGCVQRAFFGDVNQATARLLAQSGCEVHAPAAQGCCGALALHAGEESRAKDFARSLIEVFEREPVDTIAVNAAGCGSAMKEYGQLLKDDPAWADRAARFAAKVRDVSEILHEDSRGIRLQPDSSIRLKADPTKADPAPLRVAYHDACHLAHAQGIRREPRELLQRVPGVTLVPFAEGELCCGSAGIFNLVQPEMAATLGDRKASHIHASQPDVVVTSNPGCILQIRAAAARAGHTYRVMHIVEFLDGQR
jgi:glycolate oxidase iron-sulfur subunit